jgi:hypothetical protein
VTDYALGTTLGVREGALAPKIEKLLPAMLDRFDVFAVQAMTYTHARVLSLLKEAQAMVAVTEPDKNLVGRHRREALRMALSAGEDHRVVYMDFDHLLRWIENDAAELDSVLEESAELDCTVIGRGPRSFAALPAPLAATEEIVNHIYELMTGRRWDLMMAARSFSRRAARAIVDDCAVDSIGNDVAWPLFCEARGFSVGYVESEGLTYRTNLDYAADLTDSLDGDPREWARRVLLAAQHVEAMLPFMEQ